MVYYYIVVFRTLQKHTHTTPFVQVCTLLLATPREFDDRFSDDSVFFLC